MDDEFGGNYPTLYVDGVASLGADPELEGADPELERVQLQFDATANGMQSEADIAAPLGWCNSAAITLDRDSDSVVVSISVGDPRGAFAFEVRRIPADCNSENAGRLVMHVPYPGMGWAHMPLVEIRPGTYLVGDGS